jgi:hypothetical protein
VPGPCWVFVPITSNPHTPATWDCQSHPASLQRRKLRLREVNHLPQVTQQEEAELGLDLGGVLHPISISPTELSPLSWKDRAWTFSITDLHPSLPNNTYPIPLLHNVTITVAERMGPCRIMSCRLSWDASFPQRSQPRSAVEGTWRSGSGLWFHLKKAMPQRVRGLSKPMSPEETKPTP